MSKNPAWREAHALQIQLKKDAVLSEAATLFNERGYHATSLADVAEKLGFTKTAIYHYVKNKNELLYETYLRALEEIDQATEEAEAAGVSGLDKLCKYVQSPAFLHPEASALLNEIDAIDNPKRRSQLRKRLDDANARVARWVEEGVEDGSIGECDPVLTSKFVMGPFNGLPRWIRNSGYSIEDATNYFVELMKKTLAPSRKR